MSTRETFILPGAKDAVVAKGLDGLVYTKGRFAGVFNPAYEILNELRVPHL
jgi:hypothetical protein